MATPIDPIDFHWQLRGLFALLRTLVRETTTGRETVEDYASHLEGRISALARVHDMRMRAPADGLDLQELVCSEFLAQAISEQRYHIAGPEVRITREAAAPLALAIHELTLNACEHGALANGKGRVEVRWSCQARDQNNWLELQWHERDGSLDRAAELRAGFGWELIQRLLPYELGARPEFQRAAEGIRWNLSIPALATNTVWRVAAEKA
jgi:two-component sensor histidine kinase